MRLFRIEIDLPFGRRPMVPDNQCGRIAIDFRFARRPTVPPERVKKAQICKHMSKLPYNKDIANQNKKPLRFTKRTKSWKKKDAQAPKGARKRKKNFDNEELDSMRNEE